MERDARLRKSWDWMLFGMAVVVSWVLPFLTGAAFVLTKTDNPYLLVAVLMGGLALAAAGLSRISDGRRVREITSGMLLPPLLALGARLAMERSSSEAGGAGTGYVALNALIVLLCAAVSAGLVDFWRHRRAAR